MHNFGGKKNLMSQHFLAAAVSNSILLYDLVTHPSNPSTFEMRKRYETQKHHLQNISYLHFNHNNKVIASCSDDGYITYAYADSGLKMASLPQQEEEIKCISFSSGSRYLCSGGTEKLVKLWDLKEQNPNRKLIRSFKVFILLLFLL